ncbi:MAG: hypothetical protein HY070_02365 [Chloroflexi bacterium]|nr:hypothetical protein [Chloroflexota bacterium]MBI3742634.1 hypothetical protein [Chloroflexota bacterium]
MKAFEFQVTLSKEKTLEVPAEMKSLLPAGSPIRVILLLPDQTENADWARLTAQQFQKGYAEADAVYDNL